MLFSVLSKITNSLNKINVESSFGAEVKVVIDDEAIEYEIDCLIDHFRIKDSKIFIVAKKQSAQKAPRLHFSNEHQYEKASRHFLHAEQDHDKKGAQY